MKEKGLTRQEATKMVRQKRVTADPNIKFWDEL